MEVSSSRPIIPSGSYWLWFHSFGLGSIWSGSCQAEPIKTSTTNDKTNPSRFKLQNLTSAQRIPYLPTQLRKTKPNLSVSTFSRHKYGLLYCCYMLYYIGSGKWAEARNIFVLGFNWNRVARNPALGVTKVLRPCDAGGAHAPPPLAPPTRPTSAAGLPVTKHDQDRQPACTRAPLWQHVGWHNSRRTDQARSVRHAVIGKHWADVSRRQRMRHPLPFRRLLACDTCSSWCLSSMWV